MIPRLYEPITDYLESVGATGISLHHAGKHKKLRFMWQDRRYTTVVPATPGDRRWLDNQLSSLRQMLGRPDAIATDATPKRSLQDMTNELQALAPAATSAARAEPSEQQISQIAQAAYYKNGDFRVAITRDSALHREVEGKYYQLEWLTGLRYRIKPATQRGARVYGGGSKTVYFAFRAPEFKERLPIFGATNTLIRLHDSCLLFELPTERNAPRTPSAVAAKAKAIAAAPITPVVIPVQITTATWTPAAIRQVLQQVRAIEAATTYRLHRGTDGILRFAVDTIE